MPAQAKRSLPRREDRRPPPAPATAETKAAERAEHLAEIDDVLDEIDRVLEEEAETFVRGYVQKGGE